MKTFAAVMTGRGAGAISIIQVFGETAETVVKKIFKPTNAKSIVFEQGNISVGTINRGKESIDQVLIGCEGVNNFTINCHGNPLIVAELMELLREQGCELIAAEQLLNKILPTQKLGSTIELEAKLALPKAKTLQGSKIIANQVKFGLSKKTKGWLDNIEIISLSQIKTDANEILEHTRSAKLIIEGCKAVLTGPPNSGKSTLLNCLAGKQKAVVTDIKGTTRDWVSSTCQIGSVCMELIDTAGLDEQVKADSEFVAEEAQQKSFQTIEEADFALLVLDNSQTIEQFDSWLFEKIADKKVLTVLNKSDLPGKFDANKLPKVIRRRVLISAKSGDGIENLREEIQHFCGVANFDLQSAVCITRRQKNLLGQLSDAKSKAVAASVIEELLNGKVSV